MLSKNNDVDTLNKAAKLSVLSNKVLDDQDIASLTYDELQKILEFIDNNICLLYTSDAADE